ncbi:MAG: hypothetical protein ACI4DY_05685 [Monoglobaceae bacterium]
MSKNKVIKSIALIISLVMIVSVFTGCQNKQDEITDNEILNYESGSASEHKQVEYSAIAENVKKEETVYVNLNSDGTLSKINVTDWLHTDSPMVRIEDVSNLSGITNVKTLTEPIYSDDNIYWDMDTTDLYYSGTSNQEPPIKFTIKYFLDGNETTADKIVGKSGNVKIEISAENTLKKEIKVSGKKYSVSCPMLVAGGLILPEEKFSNISIDTGSALSDGEKQIIFFTGVPGIDESLGLSGLDLPFMNEAMFADKYTITADVKNFELGNMMFVAMPFSSIGTLGNGDVPETVDEIKEMLTDIENIQNAMQGLDMQKMIDLLYGDTNKIESIMQAANEASVIFKENKKMLKVFGSYMTPENMAKIDKLIEDLNNTDLDALESTLEDPMLQMLLKFLPKLSATIENVSALSEDIDAVMPILENLANDMEDPEVQKSIEMLPETLEKLGEILKTFEENKELLDALQNLSSSENLDRINLIIDTADKYSDLGNLSREELDSLAARTSEWLTFGEEYDIFTKRSDNMRSSVTFVYKTAPIYIEEDNN